jgi:hypothetical protein
MALARTLRRAPIAPNIIDFSSLRIWGTKVTGGRKGEWWRKQDGVES